MNSYNYWKFAVKREITFSKSYVDLMGDELTMGFVFGFWDALERRMIDFSTGIEEARWIMDLISMPYRVEVQKNGNMRVFNF